MRCPRRDDTVDRVAIYPVEDRWENYIGVDTCSYCGSVSPDYFLERIEQGAVLTPTDKNYKIYVDGKKKFYFQHFSKEDKERFLRFLNNGDLNLDYPGHFYRLPFFIQRVEGEDDKPATGHFDP